ncbi:MAG TPA: DUF1634 domain-containing protein [Candidatus Limnocylindria bacterium]|nr:DUF1634 domain-containing protein [Candidatus Limnocylindria bacterium]
MTGRPAALPPIDGPAAPAGPAGEGSLEVALAHVLQLGTYLSIGLVALGSVLLVAQGGSPTAGGPPLSIDGVVADLAALRPAGFLWIGIIGVLATPGLRVVRAMLGFLRREERRMATVALLVLGVIGVGVISGVMAR